MGHPTVSVVIPCYNSGPYLIDAVESARKQDGDFILNEIIVIDDHSDDGSTLNALKALKERHFVKIVPNKFPKGPSGARNTGIEMVQSEWIAFIDADDVMLTNSIDVRVKAVSGYPDINWCGGDFVKLYPDGSRSKPVYSSGQKPSLAFEGYDFNKPLLIKDPVKYFFRRMLTWSGAVLVRTEVLRKIGGFNVDLLHSEDNNLFIRIALEYDFLFIPDVTFIYRQHENSHTKRESSPKEWPIKNFKYLLDDERFRPHHKLIRRTISGFYKENSEFHFRHRRRFKGLMDHVGYIFFKYC